jgi:hypothetical protein
VVSDIAPDRQCARRHTLTDPPDLREVAFEDEMFVRALTFELEEITERGCGIADVDWQLRDFSVRETSQKVRADALRFDGESRCITAA